MYTERLTWSRFWWFVLLGPAITGAVFAVLLLVALPASWGRAPGAATVGFAATVFLAVAYAFRALEITIDDHQLTVGFPISHDRVPLDQIIACRPITYRWWEFGGYGIRWGRRGKMFNVGGDGGRVVELRRSGRGTLLFSSRNPEAVCAAIHARRPDVASA